MSSTNGKVDKAVALWANHIQRLCLLEAESVEEGMAAAEIILSTDQPPVHLDTVTDVALSYDIKNRSAQGILNKSVTAMKALTIQARKDLESALDTRRKGQARAILGFINDYHQKLSDLLTQTQLTSLLEGARQVSTRVPVLESDAQEVGEIPQPRFKTGSNHLSPIINKATEQLSSKNILTPTKYKVIEQSVRSKANTIAGVSAAETLTKIRDKLAENLGKGSDYETFKQEVMDAVEQGTFLSDKHQETVLRMATQSAFSDGQMSVLSNPLVRDKFPYSQYQPIHDERARHEHTDLDHLGIDGTSIYRNDDPVFKTFRPPWDYNCRCSWKPMTVRDAANAGVEEAKKWLESGVEPDWDTRSFVDQPPFQPPPDFQRAISDASLSIRLSIQPVALFSIDETGHEHKGKGPGGGQFVSKSDSGDKDTQDEQPKKTRSKYERLDKSALTFESSLTDEEKEHLDSLIEELDSIPEEEEQQEPEVTADANSTSHTRNILSSIIKTLSRLVGMG